MAATPFRFLVEKRYARRDVLRGAAYGVGVGAAASVLTGCSTSEFLIDTLKDQTGASLHKTARAQSTLTFEEIAKGLDDTHYVPAGYRSEAVIRWGDPVLARAPSFAPTAQSASAQAQQFGYNNDFTAYFPLGKGADASSHGLLCVNHEYVLSHLMHPHMPKKKARLR